MKVYVVYREAWRDSEEIDAIAYEVAKIFNTREKAEEYMKNKCKKEDYPYIEEWEVL